MTETESRINKRVATPEDYIKLQGQYPDVLRNSDGSFMVCFKYNDGTSEIVRYVQIPPSDLDITIELYSLDTHERLIYEPFRLLSLTLEARERGYKISS